MPLVIVCGHPCSGKSAYSLDLARYLGEVRSGSAVVVINDESLGVDKRAGYAGASGPLASYPALYCARVAALRWAATRQRLCGCGPVRPPAAPQPAHRFRSLALLAQMRPTKKLRGRRLRARWTVP